MLQIEKTSKDFKWALQLTGEKSCKEGNWASSGEKGASDGILRVEKIIGQILKVTERSVF